MQPSNCSTILRISLCGGYVSVDIKNLVSVTGTASSKKKVTTLPFPSRNTWAYTIWTHSSSWDLGNSKRCHHLVQFQQESPHGRLWVRGQDCAEIRYVRLSNETDPDLMLTIPTSNKYAISQINNSIAKAGPKAISMFHCNVRSLQKNLALLEDVLYSLDKRPEILAITETRLNVNSVCKVDLLNYELYHTDSRTSAGGAAIYIPKTLKSIPRPDIEFNMQLVESCWVEISPCNGK